MLSRTPVRRSPSPVLPGAWPLNVNTPNSIHKRSNTCPALCNILSKPPNGLVSLPYPLHLDHVRDFQQRLSLSLSRPSDPCDIPNVATAFLPSELASSDSGLSGPGSIPSDGSDLTRWNPVSHTISSLSPHHVILHLLPSRTMQARRFQRLRWVFTSFFIRLPS